MIIKVCGMREAENIREVEQTGIDWMGFIFAPKSARYVSECPAYLPVRCKRVGVFVDADIDDVVQHIRDYGLDFVQLHGSETPEYIAALRAACHVYGDIIAVPRLIKVFNIATAEDLKQTAPYAGLADYFLFDTKAQLPGGNGTKFDWSVLTEYHDPTPFILSGGIGPDDADRLRAFHHPRCIGIDLNSRFETAPALKDVDKLRAFLQTIKS